MGVELSANQIGGLAVTASVAGVAVHSAATVVRKQQSKKRPPKPVPLAILGEKESSDNGGGN